MKQHLFVLSLILFLLPSCKKSDNTDSSSTASSSGKKLAKQVETDGTYTTTTFYSYDADGKILRLRQTETGGGSSMETGLRILRKTGGMIDKVMFLRGGNSDSSSLIVVTTGQQYSSAEWNERSSYGTIIHKTTFTYDSEGHIIEATTIDNDGSGPDPKNRTTFTYASNNLSSVKIYRISGGTNILAYQYDFEYDQKLNPYAFGTEGIVLSFTDIVFYTQCANNNFTKLTFRQTGSADEIYNATYTYNEQNLPVTAVYKSSSSSQPTQNINFLYE